MKIISQDELVKISEFALAVSLVSAGFKLEALDRHDPHGRVDFCFQHENRLDELMKEYWKGNLMVNAITFYQNLRLLKARLRNETA